MGAVRHQRPRCAVPQRLPWAHVLHPLVQVDAKSPRPQGGAAHQHGRWGGGQPSDPAQMRLRGRRLDVSNERWVLRAVVQPTRPIPWLQRMGETVWLRWLRPDQCCMARTGHRQDARVVEQAQPALSFSPMVLWLQRAGVRQLPKLRPNPPKVCSGSFRHMWTYVDSGTFTAGPATSCRSDQLGHNGDAELCSELRPNLPPLSLVLPFKSDSTAWCQLLCCGWRSSIL